MEQFVNPSGGHNYQATKLNFRLPDGKMVTCNILQGLVNCTVFVQPLGVKIKDLRIKHWVARGHCHNVITKLVRTAGYHIQLLQEVCSQVSWFLCKSFST